MARTPESFSVPVFSSQASSQHDGPRVSGGENESFRTPEASEARLESSASSLQHSVSQNKSQSWSRQREGGIEPTASWEELQISCVQI